MNTLITIKNIYKEYNDNIIINDINAKIIPGSFNIIVGKSGCGKSTLIKILMGLELPDSGEIINKNKCAMVFQNSALLQWMTVR